MKYKGKYHIETARLVQIRNQVISKGNPLIHLKGLYKVKYLCATCFKLCGPLRNNCIAKVRKEIVKIRKDPDIYSPLFP